MHNKGNYVVSLGDVCRWLGQQAEAAGVEVYPGFAAAEILYDEQGRVRGVATGDMGITKEGEPGPNHQPGVELHGRVTLFARAAAARSRSGCSSASTCAPASSRRPTGWA
jgi:electron-transferring-flavoprotein dehydrogenase